jgi:hypothetical protein
LASPQAGASRGKETVPDTNPPPCERWRWNWHYHPLCNHSSRKSTRGIGWGPSVWRTSFSQRAIPPLSEQFNSLCVGGGGGRSEGSAGRNRLPVAEGNRGRSLGDGRWTMGGRTDPLARQGGPGRPSQSPAHRLCIGSPLCSARIRSGRLSPCGYSAAQAQDGTARACRASELPRRHTAIPASPRYVCGCPAQACEECRRGRRAPSRIRGGKADQRYTLCTMRNVYRLNSSRLDSDALRGGDGPTLEESGRAGDWLGGGAIFMSLAKPAIAEEPLAKAESGKRKAERPEDGAGPRSSTVRQRANGVGGT